MMRVASCSADISSEKKPTMPPLVVACVPSGLHLELIGLGDVEGDVGRERRLAHARTAGDDDEIGRLQTAELPVEIGHAGRDARQLAVALVGLGGHVDRGRQRIGEALEAAVVAPAFGDLVEPALGLLDLRAGRMVDRRVIGDVDHLLADRDEAAPDREIVDHAAVIGGVDDRRRFRRQAGPDIAGRVMPPRSWSPRKVFSVIGVAILPARISDAATS